MIAKPIPADKNPLIRDCAAKLHIIVKPNSTRLNKSGDLNFRATSASNGATKNKHKHIHNRVRAAFDRVRAAFNRGFGSLSTEYAPFSTGFDWVSHHFRQSSRPFGYNFSSPPSEGSAFTSLSHLPPTGCSWWLAFIRESTSTRNTTCSWSLTRQSLSFLQS